MFKRMRKYDDEGYINPFREKIERWVGISFFLLVMVALVFLFFME